MVKSKRIEKEIEKLDPSIRKELEEWMTEHLENCVDPRAHQKGEPLTQDSIPDGYKYTIINDYRIAVIINDKNRELILLKVGKRQNF